MAKKISPNSFKGKKSARPVTTFKKNKVLAALLLLVLLLGVGAYVLATRDTKKVSNDTSSATDLIKSEVNTKNTKDIPSTKPATGASPATDTTKTTTGSAKPKTSASSTPAATGSSGGGTTSPAAPSATPIPFELVSAYGGVDGPDWIDVGCNGSAQFNFSADINVRGAGTVTYQWFRSDGASSAPQQLVFTGSGTQTVSRSWTLYGGGSPGAYEVHGWEKVTASIADGSEVSSKASDGAFTMNFSCM